MLLRILGNIHWMIALGPMPSIRGLGGLEMVSKTAVLPRSRCAQFQRRIAATGLAKGTRAKYRVIGCNRCWRGFEVSHVSEVRLRASGSMQRTILLTGKETPSTSSSGLPVPLPVKLFFGAELWTINAERSVVATLSSNRME